MKRWVINQSKTELTKDQEKLLGHGLGFAMTPDKIPYEDYIVLTEEATTKIKDPVAQDLLRNEAMGLLRAAKPMKQNLTKGERQALKELKANDSLIILPADKGKATVVMDKEEYEKKMQDMLSDQKTYRELKSDPTEKYRKKLISTLKRLKEEKKITQDQYSHLYPTESVTPRIYGSPKIHKTGTPLRPIVDYTGSLSYNTSKALSELLTPLAGKTEHHLKNSKHLAEIAKDVKLEEDEELISHDVVGLFPSIPIPEALRIIRGCLDRDTTLPDRTRLTPSDIIDLLAFTMSTTYFTFRGKIYEQTFGTAMGSPVSVVVANLYMEWWEQTALATCPLDIRPLLWLRYVDDCYEKVKKGTADRLTAHLNTVDPTGNIKVTCEREEDKALPMLDTKSCRTEDGSLNICVYRKKTHTDQYLSFKSNHPLHNKLAVVRTLLDRNEAITTRDEDKIKEEEHIQGALAKCGYPKWTIERVKKQRAQSKEDKSRLKDKSTDKSAGLVGLPYVAGLSESFARILKRHGIASYMKPVNTLRQCLVHPKDTRPITDTEGSDLQNTLQTVSWSVYRGDRPPPEGQTGRTPGRCD